MIRTSIVVAICTYRRNEPLATLLSGLMACAQRIRDVARVGVTIVDDTADGQARPVAERFARDFELGVEYLISGRQNISLARNMAIENAAGRGEWTVMTDDDCEPPEAWLEALLDVQKRTDVDAITGLMLRRAPHGAPVWISEQPFLALGSLEAADGERLDTAFTNNSLIRSRWLRDHPDLRFEPSLGVVGGEDMAFFRAAITAGLEVRFSEHGFVFENEPMSRMTLGYQLRRFYWQGNSSYITLRAEGISKGRMLTHGFAILLRALKRPVERGLRGNKLQLRYSAALIMQAAGILVGPMGIRVTHH